MTQPSGLRRTEISLLLILSKRFMYKRDACIKIAPTLTKVWCYFFVMTTRKMGIVLAHMNI